MEEDALRQQLGIVDQSLGFLLILIASVLLLSLIHISI